MTNRVFRAVSLSLLMGSAASAPVPAAAGVSPSPDGTLEPCANVPAACGERIAFVSNRDGDLEIYSVKADGTGLARLTDKPGLDDEPAWSPDGRRIAFVSTRDGFHEIYVMDADGANVVRRTFFASYSQGPAWSPDGTRIAFSALTNGSMNLWVVSADADGSPPRPLFEAPGWDAQPAWSPDGSRLVLVSDWSAYDFVWDIYLLNADGSGFAALTGDIFDFVDYLAPSWSPNGAQIALAITVRVGTNDYVADLGVMDANGTGLTPLIAAVPFTTSSWSPDGQRIAFTSGSDATRDISWVKADGSDNGLIVDHRSKIGI